jgi:hypothetical protein
LLAHVRALVPLLADLSRADVLIGLRDHNMVRICTHARPHSIAPVYDKSLAGETMPRDTNPAPY